MGKRFPGLKGRLASMVGLGGLSWVSAGSIRRSGSGRSHEGLEGYSEPGPKGFASILQNLSHVACVASNPARLFSSALLDWMACDQSGVVRFHSGW